MTRENLAAMKEEERHTSADDSPEEALARGDHREALARCARDHGVGIGRLCMVLTGSQAEADELCHEVLLTAYTAFPSYRAEGTLRSWLFGIARKVCARHLEARTRQVRRLRLVHDAGRGPDTEALAITRERAERAREALASLKPTEREALLLRYEADLAFREVATACGVDEATARKRVSRALGRLREILAEEKKR
jgi:RNA polymerase sigma-70 factor, ECF subfamily